MYTDPCEGSTTTFLSSWFLLLLFLFFYVTVLQNPSAACETTEFHIKTARGKSAAEAGRLPCE